MSYYIIATRLKKRIRKQSRPDVIDQSEMYNLDFALNYMSVSDDRGPWIVLSETRVGLTGISHVKYIVKIFCRYNISVEVVLKFRMSIIHIG